MAIIKLTQGKVTVIDDADKELVESYAWSAHVNSSSKTKTPIYYAYTTLTGIPGKKKGQTGLYLHRLLANPPKGMHVDHINGDSLDNRRKNLRLVTRSQNNANQKPITGGTSRYKGVSWRTVSKRWIVEIMKEGTPYLIGTFALKKEEEAARAYDKKAIELHGEYARLNFPEKLERGKG